MSQPGENGDDTGLPPLGWKDVTRSLVGLVLVVLLIAFGLPNLLDTSWEEIWAQLSRVRVGPALAMAGFLLAGLAAYTFVLTGSLPGLRNIKGFQANMVSSLVGNVLPLGAALGVALHFMMFRTWGFRKREISTSLMVTGLWNLLARIALPVIGCLVLVAGPVDAPQIIVNGALLAGAVGTGVLVVAGLVVLSDTFSARLAAVLHALTGWVGRGTRLRRIENVITDQRLRVAAVVRTGGLQMTLGMAGQFVLLFGLYWVAARSVGLDVSLPALIAAYTFRQMLTALALTPGGLGVTEVGTAGLLVILGGSPGAASATALLYAIYAHLVVVPVGVVALLLWRVEARREAARAEAPPAPG